VNPIQLGRCMLPQVFRKEYFLDFPTASRRVEVFIAWIINYNFTTLKSEHQTKQSQVKNLHQTNLCRLHWTQLTTRSQSLCEEPGHRLFSCRCWSLSWTRSFARFWYYCRILLKMLREVGSMCNMQLRFDLSFGNLHLQFEVTKDFDTPDQLSR
jgi:hypothetical protein